MANQLFEGAGNCGHDVAASSCLFSDWSGHGAGPGLGHRCGLVCHLEWKAVSVLALRGVEHSFVRVRDRTPGRLERCLQQIGHGPACLRMTRCATVHLLRVIIEVTRHWVTSLRRYLLIVVRGG